ncbi:MAG TPA: hypothetical protein VF636_07245 [Sphingomonas sp.]|jgi:hypothetical protein
MDLNYLLHRHQVSLMRADRAACDASRDAHHDLATGYASRISAVRGDWGATRPMVLAR